MVQLGLHLDEQVDVTQDHPDPKIKAIGPEPHEIDARFGEFRNIIMAARDLHQDLGHPSRVASIGDAHVDHHPAHGVATGPVRHRAGNEIGVGHDHIGLVEGLDRGGAHGDVLDDPHVAVDLDPVALRDRALDQQDDARDEVRHHVLQAETDADRQRADHKAKRREVDARACHRDECGQPDPHIAHARADGIARAHIHLGARQNGGFQRALQQARDHQADREHQDHRKDDTRRDPRLTQGKTFENPRV